MRRGHRLTEILEINLSESIFYHYTICYGGNWKSVCMYYRAAHPQHVHGPISLSRAFFSIPSSSSSTVLSGLHSTHVRLSQLLPPQLLLLLLLTPS